MKTRVRIAYRKIIPGMFKKQENKIPETAQENICEKMFYTLCGGKKYIFPESIVRQHPNCNWSLC